MTLDRRALLTAGLTLPFVSAAAAQAAWTRPAGLAADASVALWPEGHIQPPAGLVEAVVQRSGDPNASDRMLQGITRPQLDIFRPGNDHPPVGRCSSGQRLWFVQIHRPISLQRGLSRFPGRNLVLCPVLGHCTGSHNSRAHKLPPSSGYPD